MLRSSLVIARRILRQRLRDRSAIVFAVLTPLGLAVAFAAIIPDFSPTFHTTIVVVDRDGGRLGQVLRTEVLGRVAETGIATIATATDETAATTEIEADRASAAIVIPPGFTDAVNRGDPAEIRILAGSNPTAREVARAVVTAFAADVGTVQLAVRTIVATGGQADQATIDAATNAVHGASPIAVAQAAADKRQASMSTFYGAAMAIMFVFFATQYGALALLADRRDGTLNRLLAAPIAPAAIVLGGALAGMVLGLVAMTTLVVATTVLVHASWGPPVLLATLLIAAVIAATGISTLVSTLAKTVEQAGGLNAIIALSLAAIGGVFIPLSQAPELLGRIALITPHAWFLRAIDTMSVANVGLAEIMPSVVVLVVMGVVTGALGLARARNALVPR
ncbi:MAG TPA: ABC transporter permease [Candidatus Deferrimicrobium sp.]|nr:ABC transporter permease [Candidatus Deferrimicrobium sp.]